MLKRRSESPRLRGKLETRRRASDTPSEISIRGMVMPPMSTVVLKIQAGGRAPISMKGSEIATA